MWDKNTLYFKREDSHKCTRNNHNFLSGKLHLTWKWIIKPETNACSEVEQDNIGGYNLPYLCWLSYMKEFYNSRRYSNSILTFLRREKKKNIWRRINHDHFVAGLWGRSKTTAHGSTLWLVCCISFCLQVWLTYTVKMLHRRGRKITSSLSNACWYRNIQLLSWRCKPWTLSLPIQSSIFGRRCFPCHTCLTHHLYNQ